MTLGLLPLICPILLLSAAWVRAVSRGSILFAQERVGHGGKRFWCLKLRTMVQGCSSSVHEQHVRRAILEGKPVQKLDRKDDRLIPGAWLLRSLGVDELPQLFNVLRGEMSLVGPRPCVPYEAEQCRGWELERFSGLPGLTGLWQVRGKNSTTFAEMVRLDVTYLRQRSFWLDLRIICATPAVLVVQAFTALSRGESRRSMSDCVPPVGDYDGFGDP